MPEPNNPTTNRTAWEAAGISGGSSCFQPPPNTTYRGCEHALDAPSCQNCQSPVNFDIDGVTQSFCYDCYPHADKWSKAQLIAQLRDVADAAERFASAQDPSPDRFVSRVLLAVPNFLKPPHLYRDRPPMPPEQTCTPIKAPVCRNIKCGRIAAEGMPWCCTGCPVHVGECTARKYAAPPPDSPERETSRAECRGNKTGYHTCGLPIGGCGKTAATAQDVAVGDSVDDPAMRAAEAVAGSAHHALGAELIRQYKAGLGSGSDTINSEYVPRFTTIIREAYAPLTAELADLRQTSGDPCSTCGWRGKRGDGCAFCGVAALTAEVERLKRIAGGTHILARDLNIAKAQVAALHADLAIKRELIADLSLQVEAQKGYADELAVMRLGAEALREEIMGLWRRISMWRHHETVDHPCCYGPAPEKRIASAVEFCGHAVCGDRGGPAEACGKPLPCADHPTKSGSSTATEEECDHCLGSGKDVDAAEAPDGYVPCCPCGGSGKIVVTRPALSFDADALGSAREDDTESETPSEERARKIAETPATETESDESLRECPACGHTTPHAEGSVKACERLTAFCSCRAEFRDRAELRIARERDSAIRRFAEHVS